MYIYYFNIFYSKLYIYIYICISVFVLVFKAALQSTTNWMASGTELYFCTVLEPRSPRSRC